MFICRTKFDNFHPDVDDEQLDGDEDAEEAAYVEAIAQHMQDQTAAYHGMIRDIASPLLPMTESAPERQKLEEMRDRINSIDVFFLIENKALAAVAFCYQMIIGPSQ